MTREEIETCRKDPRNRKWGFYYCKADPRVIVPRGLKWMGWTVMRSEHRARQLQSSAARRVLQWAHPTF
jgi:hypothetical protein